MSHSFPTRNWLYRVIPLEEFRTRPYKYDADRIAMLAVDKEERARRLLIYTAKAEKGEPLCGETKQRLGK